MSGVILLQSRDQLPVQGVLTLARQKQRSTYYYQQQSDFNEQDEAL